MRLERSNRLWHPRPMSSNVVNLNRFRKKKAKEERVKQAETNSRLHGRTKAEKQRELSERTRASQALEGKRLEGDAATASAEAEAELIELSEVHKPE